MVVFRVVFKLCWFRVWLGQSRSDGTKVWIFIGVQFDQLLTQLNSIQLNRVKSDNDYWSVPQHFTHSYKLLGKFLMA